MRIVNNNHRHCAVFAAALAACPQCAVAESLPLWEIGVGAAAISFPDYRGSGNQHRYLLPVPTFVYRGDLFQVDRQKIRGLIYKGKQVEIEVSINGSVPVRSNTARQGMPDLDPTFEIGPTLNVTLAENLHSKLSLRLPARAVIASDFRSVQNAGILANPNINLDIKSFYGWQLGLVAGVLFGDKKYHQHFYGIAPAYALPERPAYRAPGGYSGLQFIAALSRRFESFHAVGFVKYDVINGASFESSPLVARRNNLSVGFALTLPLLQSSVRVERSD